MLQFLWNLTIKPVLLLGSFIYSVTYRYTNATTKGTLAIVLVILLLLIVAIFRVLEYKKGCSSSSNKLIKSFQIIGELKGKIYLLLALSVFMGLYIPTL